MPALIAAVCAASAQDLVIHDGADPARATSLVAPYLGGRPPQLATLPELLGGDPPSASSAVLTPCDGPPTSPDAVKMALERAEGAMLYLEIPAATAALAEAETALGCLGAPVAPQTAARVHFLVGVLAQQRGDDPTPAFERALAFVPGLGWDPDLPPDARSSFDRVAARTVDTLELHLVPHVGWVDGEPVDAASGVLSVRPGPHQILVDGRTWTVSVDRPTTVLVPSAVAATAVEWAHDPHLAADLEQVLGGRSLHLVTSDGVYRSSDGPLARLLPETPPYRRRSPARALTWGGSAGVLAGGALAAVSWIRGTQALHDAASPPTWDAYHAAVARRDTAARTLAAGEITFGIGLTVAGVGIGIRP